MYSLFQLRLIVRKRLIKLSQAYHYHFPATDLAHDHWSYFFNFSIEIVLIIVTLTIAGYNLYGFVLSKHQDESLALKFLSYHPGLNQSLYTHSNIRGATVTLENGLINTAFAEDFRTRSAELSAQTTGDGILHDNIMIKPSPASIQELVERQFVVHEVKAGETLSSIAQTYTIKSSTLQWSNKLPDSTIKPGWHLLIPPIDGVLVQVEDLETTLPDLAKKYRGDLEKIIAYNGLSSAEDIDQDQFIMIPGGSVPPPVKPKPTILEGRVTVQPTPGGHIFAKGHCTYYVASRMFIPWGGNAKNWPENSRKYGARLGSVPIAGSIVVTTSSPWGHVAIVEEVFNDGTFTITEMNYKGIGIISQRRLNINDDTIRTFISYP